MNQSNTPAAEAWWEANNGEVPLVYSPLNELELGTVLHRKGVIWEKGDRVEGMSPLEVERSKQLFAKAVNDGTIIRVVPPSEEEIYAEAQVILRDFAAGIQIRSLDTLHLAIARLIGADTMLSLDGSQRQLAFNAGLFVPPLPPNYPNSP